jgi:prevent-host-death family protein
METFEIHEAKTHLSRLVDRAARGEAFVIAKAGKPLVKVSSVDAPSERRRLGFLKGEVEVPDDFNDMGGSEIAALFGIGAREAHAE